MTDDNQDREASRKRPERGVRRAKWERWHVVTIASLATFTAGVVAIGTSLAPSQSPPGAAAKGPPVANAARCRTRANIERDTSVADDTVLRRAPARNATPIVNPEGTTKPSDIRALATATASVPLRIMCEEGDWTRVRVLATELRWMEGWVPKDALRKLVLDDAGHRVLTAADLEWQPGSEKDRRAIVKVANLILRDDKRCEAIDDRSLLVEGTRSDRRYTLLCDGPEGSFPITFTARDAAARSFAEVVTAPVEPSVAGPISKSDAADACMDAISAQLAQPRSADFHTFSDTTFNVEGSRVRFTVGFDAKNGLGLEVENMAACIFEGSTLVSAEVLPAGS